ncbi:hypothetical protein R3P38DRAFT_3088762 [Favolaschia claudopus]|uniref:Uncharacterized protein n=1 Tax=Favolaschia claudopus TaxID=2862362 RepID=A0AAV9ZTR6_9AGAR
MQATPTHLVNGHTATALQSSEIHSRISAHYARSLGLLVSSHVPSLFVSLSAMASVTGSNSPFFTHHPFAIRVAENLPADIMLASDWSTICRAAAWNGGVVFATGTYEAAFNLLPGMCLFHLFLPHPLLAAPYPSRSASLALRDHPVSFSCFLVTQANSRPSPTKHRRTHACCTWYNGYASSASRCPPHPASCIFCDAGPVTCITVRN